MKSIIVWTLSQRKASTLWWIVGMVVFIFIGMIFYPSFKDSAPQFEQSFSELPDAAVELFGGSTDFFSPVGYANSQIYFISLPLLLGILAISLGSKVVAKEEADKTIEGLLSRPVSRTKLLLAKAIAATIILALVSKVTAVSMIIMSAIVDLDISTANLIVVSFVCFLLTLSFGAIAFLFTTIGRASSMALGVATLIAFGGYLIDSLAGTVTWLQVPAKLFPFHYYQSEAALNGEYNWWNTLYFVGLIAVSAVISWLAFRRRDLK